MSPVRVEAGDCLEVMRRLIDEGVTVDAVVTDPPYGLAFMGRAWDAPENIAFRAEVWGLALRLLKPGGHLAAFSGTRTYHRMATAIEDAGFEIRDQLAWAYGSGFPKSHDVAKGIDKAAGAVREVVGSDTKARSTSSKIALPTVGGETKYRTWDITAPATEAARQWQGWGTALKPAWEPICLARKPLAEKSVAANVLEHGTGAINIDACRVAGEKGVFASLSNASLHGWQTGGDLGRKAEQNGRWPANLVHDGSAEVLAGFPEAGAYGGQGEFVQHAWAGQQKTAQTISKSEGSAARFFYTAKADAGDRLGSKHPTVKPLDLMAWLCRLLVPPGGVVLDPFAGTGTTGMAAMREGFRAILIEREPEYLADIARRLAHVKGEDAPLFGGGA